MLLIRPINCNDIEPAWLIRESWMLSQVGARGQSQFSLLGVPYGLSGSVIVVAATVSDLHEYQAVLIHHDQVNLAKPTAEVTLPKV
jgi:hypothetical protein